MQPNTSLSSSDASTLLQLLNRSAACASEKDFHHLMCGMKALIPYESMFGVLRRRGPGQDMTYHAVTIDCSKVKLEITRGLCDHNDALKKKKFAQFPVHHWEGECNNDRFAKNCVSMFYDAERNYGFTHWEKDYGRIEGSMFSLSGKSVIRNRRAESILLMSIPHLHYALRRALKPDQRMKDMLSPKEKEVLKWLKFGKSSWDISAILGISERTVKFHVANITQKLNASNRSHAVAIAIEQRMFDNA